MREEDTKKNYSILIIEDNPGDFALVEEFITEQFHLAELRHAKSYREAYEVLTGNEDAFDVVLLDLSLPDKTGAPLIAEIVTLCPQNPVIVLTGYTDLAFGVNSLSLGVSDYLLKEELSAASLSKSILYSLERKKINTELLESEQKYSELFHLSPQPMWVLTPKTLTFLKVNKAAIKHFGYSPAEFIGMSLTDIYAGSENEPAAVDDSIENKDDLPFGNRCRLRKKNGELLHVELRSNKLQYKGNVALVVLAVDVTAQIKYIREIEKQNRTLKEISWIQSHVVRAPLARMLGLLHLLQETEDPAEKSRIVNYLLCSANELDDIIRDITQKIQLNDNEENKNIPVFTE